MDFEVYDKVKSELMHADYTKEAQDESFFCIRRSIHPSWRGWNRLDELRSKGVSQDQYSNDSLLSQDALNFIFDSYMALELNDADYETARMAIFNFLNTSQIGEGEKKPAEQPQTTPQTTQSTGVGGTSKWRKQKNS